MNENLGKRGEEIAADYLKSLGYTILDQNWRCERYEIDIICVNKTDIVFVEVKAHNPNKLFDITKMVDREKQRKIIYCANRYVRMKNISLDVRFDIIVVTKNKEEYSVEHLQDAFYCLRR